MSNKVNFTKNGLLIDGELFTLQQIQKECNRVKVDEDNLVLLKLYWKGGRGSSDITEQKVMKAINVEPLLNIIVGQEVHFGEIFGKHSNVYGNIDKEDITVETDFEKVVDFLINNPYGSDYNFSFLENLMENIDAFLADKIEKLIVF